MRVIVRFRRVSACSRTTTVRRSSCCLLPISLTFPSMHTTCASILANYTSIQAPYTSILVPSAPSSTLQSLRSALYPIPLPHTRVPVVVKAALLVACALPAAPLGFALWAVRVRVVGVAWGMVSQLRANGKNSRQEGAWVTHNRGKLIGKV